MKQSLDRRGFLKAVAASAAGVTLGAHLGPASAAEKLALTDPMAVALGYTDKAETAKDPTYKAGSKCDGCALYAAAQASGGFAPCGAMGGKLVAAAGWCKAFAPKG